MIVPYFIMTVKSVLVNSVSTGAHISKKYREGVVFLRICAIMNTILGDASPPMQKTYHGILNPHKKENRE